LAYRVFTGSGMPGRLAASLALSLEKSGSLALIEERNDLSFSILSIIIYFVEKQ
jgi:hypothetical protein